VACARFAAIRRTQSECESPCFQRTAKIWSRRAGAWHDDPSAWNPAFHLENINQFLEQAVDLPPEKREKILQRKAWLEEKVQNIQNRSSPAPATPAACAAVPNTAEPLWGPARCLAKIQERLNQPDLPPHVVERLNHKKAKLEQRIANPCDRPCRGPAARLEKIQLKLADPNLPAHRREKLTLKKAFLEAALKQTNEPSGVCPVLPRPQLRLAWINQKLENSDLSPECHQRLIAKKACLEEKLKGSEGNGCQFEARKAEKMAWIQKRLSWIQKRLEDPNLPAEKRERLNLKKAAIEAKMTQHQSPSERN
jgi:hypothetical protein